MVKPFHRPLAGWLLGTCAALWLAGCSTLVPSTAARLATMDPLTADPAQIEVALILPAGLQVAQNGAKLTIEATRGDQVEKAQVTLQDSPLQLSGFAVPEGARAITLRIRSTDIDRLRATQRRIAAWRADKAEKTSGSFGVGLAACTIGSGPAENAVASMLIRTETGAPFQPLIKGAHLRDALGAKVYDAIQPCEGAQ
jgi:hypothetical protein